MPNAFSPEISKFPASLISTNAIFLLSNSYNK